MTLVWCLTALICASILPLELTSGQQQQQVLNDIKSQGSATSKSGQKIGLAPHERPACQLPPTISPAQRRHLQAVRVDSNQATEQAHHSNELSKLIGSSSSSSSSSINQLKSKPTSDEPSISAPNVISLPGALNGSSASSPGLNNWTSRRSVESSERLRQLRQLLVSNNYDAYLVTPSDEHGSGYVSDYDRRLRFISGFSGSNGYALILLDRAVLFTDGRYELQADQELDCNWWLVVGGEPLEDLQLWLRANNLRNLKVATDARLLSLENFDYLNEHLRNLNSEFALISQDLVDIVWSNYLQTSQHHQHERPIPREPLFVHPLEFTGNISWQEKVTRLAASMQKLQARHYAIAQLDDIAWLLNLRGSDIPMSPLFKAYLIISRQSGAGDFATSPLANPTTTQQQQQHQQQQQQQQYQTTRTTPPVVISVEQLLASQQTPPPTVASLNSATPNLMLQSPQVTQFQVNQVIKLTLYIDLSKITPTIRQHLHLDNGTLVIGPVFAGDEQTSGTGGHSSSRIHVDIKDYDVFIMDFRDRFSGSMGGGQKSLSSTSGRLLLDGCANVAIHVLAKNYDDRLVLTEPLVRRLKSVKSDQEVQGMRLAHWRDSLAISMLLSQLDRDIDGQKLTTKWTEISASKELEFYRSLMDYNRGQSFATISAYGANGAVIHYTPDESVPRDGQQLIGNQSTYLLDSGGQYLDGTTDITRTVHYGQPTNLQRETYTRVLMGSIDLMSVIFEQTSRSAYKLNDLLARRHLSEIGLDYAHGTGHGIGLFSMVHEAPWLLEHYTTGKSSAEFTNKSLNSNNNQNDNKQLANTNQINDDPIQLQENMFTSVEPGYYRANEFGIRLENIVVSQRVEPASQLANEAGQQKGPQSNWLRFEPISLVPFEPKLIKFELLSNKQKAWLNSFNLMVRLRLTQQINHYLAKIRQAQDQLNASPSSKAQQVLGTASSSRLFRQLQQQQQQQSNQTSAETAPIVNNRNFLKLNGDRFQRLLEDTHKWIMQKTELIPLDVPQRSSSTLIKAIQNSKFTKQDDASGRQQDEWSALSSDAHGQRLMLAYMSAMPFNDREAAAALVLAGRASGGPADDSDLGEQQTRNNNNEKRTTTHAASSKCTGFECDLWLLEALNSVQKTNQGAKRQTTATTTAVNGNSWPQTMDEDNMDPGGLSGAPGEGGGQMLSQLMDLFKLNDSMNQSAGRLSSLLGSLWPLWSFGVLFLLQLALMGYVCRRGSRAEQRRASSTSAHSSRRQSMPLTSTAAGPTSLPPVVAANNNISNDNNHNTGGDESRFVNADFGQQVVI